MQWAFGFLSVIINIYGRKSLPLELQTYLNSAGNPELSVAYHNIISFAVPPILFFVNFIASIGVFLIRSWARKIYLCSLSLYPLLHIILGGILVSRPYACTLNDYSLILVGFTIGLLYFSPLKRFFEKGDNRLTQTEEGE